MEADELGPQGFTYEDARYRGTRFAEVRDAIFANSYQKVWGRSGESPLPVYQVTLRSVLRGVLPFGGPYLFRKATERAVDSHADLRWGPDRKGYRRLLYPNGICLTGFWQVVEENPYSGYFKKRQPGAGDRTLFHVLYGDPARPRAFAVASGKALSHDGRQSRRATSHRQLHYPTGPRRRLQ
jgi:hypothetical protein